MSISYGIPGFMHCGHDIVHNRPMGQKIGGFYQNVSWSDVALQGVAIDKTLNLEVQDQIIDANHVLADMLGEYDDYGDYAEDEDARVARVSVKTNGSSNYDRGSKPKHVKGIKPTYEHKGRPIPNNKSKTYTTKPRIKSKEHRCKYGKHM